MGKDDQAARDAVRVTRQVVHDYGADSPEAESAAYAAVDVAWRPDGTTDDDNNA
ncbi:hypothetical protein ACHZ98_22615 [Streptomyces sp. MAR4 CNY-716]